MAYCFSINLQCSKGFKRCARCALRCETSFVIGQNRYENEFHWLFTTVVYQQIENSERANQIHRFTIDHCKFILILDNDQPNLIALQILVVLGKPGNNYGYVRFFERLTYCCLKKIT